METLLRKHGNSLGLVIPKLFRDSLGLRAGQRVILEETEQGGLLVRPGIRKYSLEELLSHCDPNAPAPQEMQDWENAPACGEEVW